MGFGAHYLLLPDPMARPSRILEGAFFVSLEQLYWVITLEHSRPCGALKPRLDAAFPEPMAHMVPQKGGNECTISGVTMKPKLNPKTHQWPMLRTVCLDLAIDTDHEVVILAQSINWDAITTKFRPMYYPDNGRPAVPTRLMAGLQLLKSDEQTVARWVENPYWQFFCDDEYFQHELPIHHTQMTRWRQRIGEKGVEKLLAITIETGKTTKTITERSFEKVIVDTTVQSKAIQHPTDTQQYRKIHATMLRAAEEEGIQPCQSYRLLMDRVCGHMKAKQFKRARRC